MTHDAHALVERHQETVRRIVWRVLGPSSELEDVMQDVMVALLRSAHTLQESASESAWVRAVAVNTVRMHLRWKGRWGWRRSELNEEQMQARVQSPESRQLISELYGALSRMSNDLRIAWTLRFVEGASLNEVAEACGISHSSAKRRVAKAKQRLEVEARRRPALQRALAQGGADESV